MQRNIKNRALAIAAFATLAVAAIAVQSSANFSGRLDPESYRDHVYTVGPGLWDVDLTNQNPGDLDVKVYDEDGNLLCEDILDDNLPMCTFRNRYRQEITIRVINADDYRTARYSGTVE
jgi:hypothetical protein